MTDDSYLEINRANWDARADVHVGPDGYRLDAFDDPEWISDVVAFDRPRLGDLTGLDVVHLQCHIGTDTVSLARLGARMAGLDLSPRALAHARTFAARAGVDVEFVESDVYGAVEALGPARFDLVYTGIGAICWLPDIDRWARTVAALLRPGGRLFIRDGHPVLNSLAAVVVGNEYAERDQQPDMTAPGGMSPALEFPYYTQPEYRVWREETSYAGSTPVASPVSVEWNHSIGEILTAVLSAGLTIDTFVEHDSVPWDALPGMMTLGDDGEYRLSDRPERLPASFTLIATRPASDI